MKLTKKKIKSLSEKTNYFAWLKRRVDYDTLDLVRKQKIKGLHHLLEPDRYYPGGSSASNFLGYVGIDNTGLFGLEKNLESYLSGTRQSELRFKDARGSPILYNTSAAAPQTPGLNVVLSLDHVIQELVETALDKGVKEAKAKGGFAVVADPHTGRIIALANRPTFNPNNSEQLSILDTKNLALNYLFEPGSIMKPLVLSYALEKGLVDLSTQHDCEKNGIYEVTPGTFIRDDHPRPSMTTEDIIIHSSNICIYKIARLFGKEALFDLYTSFGLGAGSKNINSKVGSVDHWSKWREIRFANLAFGQGLLVNGLEMIRAYSVFANGGYVVEPYVIERIETASGEILQGPPPSVRKSILSHHTVDAMQDILHKVVLHGTGKRSQLQGFSSAGKTGTSEKFDLKEKQYSLDKRLASFIGFAPAFDPHLVIYVVIDEPAKKPYYGGLRAAPVFKEIAEQALKYLNVAEDLTKEENEDSLVVDRYEEKSAE
ncbi:MAG: hypothetical protein CMP11_06475 [Zetaproteobacteria bacterium]|nr:hypothetical protein [Pseudobdellovibrionaceae bacterium]